MIARMLALLLALAGTCAAAAPVTVELFQSQGCSSCPPANANLNALAGRADVIALSYGVTYWDRLGWKDRFATAEGTQRQREYAHARGRQSVWTPQIYIDGRADVVGTRRAEIEAEIAKRARRATGPALTLAPSRVGVAAGRAPAGGADVWLVRYDPRTLEVPIRAGENGGRTLAHRNVVRQLVALGRWTGEATSFALPPAPAGLRTAVLVQAPKGGPIIAAAKS